MPSLNFTGCELSPQEITLCGKPKSAAAGYKYQLRHPNTLRIPAFNAQDAIEALQELDADEHVELLHNWLPTWTIEEKIALLTHDETVLMKDYRSQFLQDIDPHIEIRLIRTGNDVVPSLEPFFGNWCSLLSFFQALPAGEKTNIDHLPVEKLFRRRPVHNMLLRMELWSVEEAVPHTPTWVCDCRQSPPVWTQEPRPPTTEVLLYGEECIEVWVPPADSLPLTLPDRLTPLEQRLNRYASVSEWKSMMHKLIRSGTRTIQFLDGPTAADLLETVLYSLANHAGVFLPDLQIFVPGKVSLLKRLAVIALEDSYAEPLTVTTLLTLAKYANEHPWWVLPQSLMEWVVHVSHEMQRDGRCFHYPITNKVFPKKRVRPDPLKPIANQLIHELRSFEGDLALFDQWTSEHVEVKTLPTDQFPECLDEGYFIDQHCWPSLLGWFAEPDLLRTSKTDDFSEYFLDFFRTTTGANARRGVPIPLHNAHRVSQAAMLEYVLGGTVKPPPSPPSTDTFQTSLPPTLLTNMVPKMVIHHEQSKWWVFVLWLDDCVQYRTMRAPVRENSKEEALPSDELRETIIEMAKGRWSTLTLPIRLAAWKVVGRLRCEDWCFYTEGSEEWVDWGEFCATQSQELSIAPLRHLRSTLSDSVVARWTMYWRPLHQSYTLYDISRSGLGKTYMVSHLDREVFHAWRMFAAYYPDVCTFEQGVLQVTQLHAFFTLRQWWLETEQPEFAEVLTRPRPLFPHQEQSIVQIRDRWRLSSGAVVWMPIGSGKTPTAIEALLSMFGKQILVYLAPAAAAVGAISAEWLRYGIPVQKILPTEPLKNWLLDRVYVVEHDVFRTLLAPNKGSKHATTTTTQWKNSFLKHLPQMVMVFDEMHLLFADTKRSSVALMCAKLCYRFIGMTGTLIRNANWTGLMEWLSLVVPFEVTKESVWAAISTLVSATYPVNIVVTHEEVAVTMNAAQHEDYRTLVTSALGGSANLTSFYRSMEFCQQVVVQHWIDVLLPQWRSARPLFLVLPNQKLLQQVQLYLTNRGAYVLTIPATVDLTRGQPFPPNGFILSTYQHCTTYTATVSREMWMIPTNTNQANIQQMEGRIARQTQDASVVIKTFYTGILTNMYLRKQSVKALMEAAATIVDKTVVNT